VSYDDRPWLKRYDDGIEPEIAVPEISLVEQFNATVASFPKNPALHFFGVTLSYFELLGYVNRFADVLIKNGCLPGDIVGINLPNIPQYLIAQMAALKAGCATSGMSPLLTARELVYQLNDCRAKVLVTLDAIFEHRFEPVSNELPYLKLVVATGIMDFLPWFKRFLGRMIKKVPHGKVRALKKIRVLRFMEALSTHSSSEPGVRVGADDYCLVQYTGGTTGIPKGTILTHRNMAANLTQIDHWIKPDFGAEVLLSGFPLFHLAGLALGLASVFMGAAQILIPNPRDTRHIVKEMAKYRPTMLVNVPSLYMMLLEDPGFRKLDFSTLSFCLSGASPFPTESIGELEKVVGEGRVLEVYGMTEASPIVTMNPRRGRKKIGTVGLPISSTRVRLVDLETGNREVPIGDEGELIVNGPQVMQGYLNRPEETNIALRSHDGLIWLHTGDVGRMDEEGFITLVDRAKDMLNVGGFKVFSREVEEKLYEHPAIEFCAIVGVPNTRRPGTDLVKLVVQPSQAYKNVDHETIKDELLAFSRENFSPYKVPRFIEVVENMPLTVVGKVDKKALR
jgi:long-chain acyl-CoA synthetase